MSTPDGMTEQERAARRTEVRQLADEGLSQRAIGLRLGISKDTVRRDLARNLALVRAEESQAPAGARHEPAPPAETPAPPVIPVDPIALLTAASPQLAEDLATLTACGRPAFGALAYAVHYMADAYRNGWQSGLVPRGTEPQIDVYKIKRTAPISLPIADRERHRS